MKMRLLAIIAGLLISTFAPPIPQSMAAPTCAAGGECVVGDTGPGGGKVFFVKSTGTFTKSRTEGVGWMSQTYSLSLTADEQAALPFDYLEVAPTQSGSFRWGSNGGISGGTSALIGTGASNTANIIASFPGDNATNNAAYFAEGYVNNSLSDWFLPSYDELLLINILSLESDSGGPNIGSFPDGHWASTSVDNSNARYSARTQLSGYVVKASSAKTVAIRSFSKIASTPTTVDSDATRRENERKRQEAIAKAQNELVQKVQAHIEVLRADLASAEAALIGQPLLARANSDFLTIDTSTVIDFPRINLVILKYASYDQIAGNLPGTVYARDLVSHGVISNQSPMKELTTYQLMKLPASERDSIEKVDSFFAAAALRISTRTQHLTATIARIQSFSQYQARR